VTVDPRYDQHEWQLLGHGPCGENGRHWPPMLQMQNLVRLIWAYSVEKLDLEQATFQKPVQRSREM